MEIKRATFFLSFLVLLSTGTSLLQTPVRAATLPTVGVVWQEHEDTSYYEHVSELPGVTILGTSAIDPSYLDIAAEIYKHMTSRRDPLDIPALHSKSNFKILLIGENERFSRLPEYEGQGRMIDRAAGLGGQIGEFFIGVKVGSPHALVHELGHGIYHSGIQYGETGGEKDEEKWYRERVKAVYGMSFEKAQERHGNLIHEVLLAREDTFSSRLATAWRNAQVKKLWKDTYAGSEPNEYWAEGVTMWFRAYSEIEGDSRKYLKEKDQLLYELCAAIFPNDDWTPDVAVKAVGATAPFADRNQQQTEDETEPDEVELEEFFNELDQDGDGKIQRTEVPEENHSEFDETDINGDGVVTRKEFQKAFAAMDDSEPDSSDDNSPDGVTTEHYFGVGNPDADTVIVNTQGGPMPSLLTDEFIEVFSEVDLENAFVVNVHQAHTKYPEKVSERIISFDEAKAIDQESVNILADVVDSFLKQKKKVVVVGISFGAWMVQDLLATQGSVADGYVIVVGRLDMPDVIWKSFSKGGGGYFEGGVTPIAEQPDPIEETELQPREIAEQNMAKVAAGLGHKRYTELLADVDLSKVHYLYGEKDEPVGRLSDAEIEFLKRKHVDIIATQGGHGNRELDRHMIQILNEFIESTDQGNLQDESARGLKLTGEARMIMALLDLNNDGIIQQSELEGDAREWLQGVDQNHDNEISAEELAMIADDSEEDLQSRLLQIDTFQNPHRIVELPESIRKELGGQFTKYSNIFAPNGKPIHFLAMNGWSDSRILRARKVLEHFLTDVPHRQWGRKTELANELANNHATMVLLNHSRDMDRVMPVLERTNLECQDLRANESPFEGELDYMQHETRDAAFEEVFHLVHGKGLIFVMKEYDREIRKLAKNATEADLWNYDEPNMPGNHFEYVICVIDNYLDLWKTNPTKMEGRRIPSQRPGVSFNGEYKAEDRASTWEADPEGFKMVEKFNPEHIAYSAELPTDFTGSFSVSSDGGYRYSNKAKHLLNVTARGSNEVNLTGNLHNNRLVGNEGDNILTGNGGDDSLFGGDGRDVAVYRGKRSQYTIRQMGDLIEVHDSVVNRDGYDVLSQIEVLKFSDQTIEN